MNFSYFYLNNIFDISKTVNNIYRDNRYFMFFFFFCIIEIYVYKFCGKNVSMINVMGLNIHKNKHMLAKNVTSTNKII